MPRKLRPSGFSSVIDADYTSVSEAGSGWRTDL